jgi:hypothetical protein
MDVFEHLGVIEQALNDLADKLNTQEGTEIVEGALGHLSQVRTRLSALDEETLARI